MNAKYIYWELSHYCNLRCKQCFARANNDASTIVDREVLFSAINKVADANMSAIRFGGGEPLMVPYLFDLMKLCRSRGISVDITSNGMLLNEAALRQLSLLGLRELTISIDGLEKNHDFLRGQGTYSRLQQILDNAIDKADFLISLGYTVTSINYHEIRDFVEAHYKKGIRKFYFFRYCGDNHADQLALNPDQLRRATEVICQLPAAFPEARFISEGASFYNFLITGDGCREGCNFLNGILTIDYLGDLIVCAATNRKLGNIYTDEFSDLLKAIDREQQAIREIPEACSGCVHREVCHGGCKSKSYSQYQNYSNRDLLCFYTVPKE